MTALVVDAAVGLKWVIPEQFSDAAHALRQFALHVPDIFFSECANVLWRKVTLGELHMAEATSRVRALCDAPIISEPARDVAPTALQLSVALAHPAYDCFYLAVAMRRGIVVVTADRRFLQAARRNQTLKAHVAWIGDFTPPGGHPS